MPRRDDSHFQSSRQAGFIHRFGLRLEPTRRTDRAKLSVGVDDDIYSVGDARCHATNRGDKGSRLKFAVDEGHARFVSNTKGGSIELLFVPDLAHDFVVQLSQSLVG